MGSAIIFGIACFFIPLCAWLVINQDWQFIIPFLNLTYKPWRLFLVVCGLPELLAFIILLFLPESPKFVLGQGDKIKAYDILRRVHQINNVEASKFEEFEIHEEAESIENKERILESRKSRFPLLASIWIQTAPIFTPPYLFPTILICLIQFVIYATGNGIYLFYADILNKMASNLDNFFTERISMCDIINMKPINVTVFDEPSDDVSDYSKITYFINFHSSNYYVIGLRHETSSRDASTRNNSRKFLYIGFHFDWSYHQ